MNKTIEFANEILNVINSNNLYAQSEYGDEIITLVDKMFEVEDDMAAIQLLTFDWDELAEEFNYSQFAKENNLELPVY